MSEQILAVALSLAEASQGPEEAAIVREAVEEAWQALEAGAAAARPPAARARLAGAAGPLRAAGGGGRPWCRHTGERERSRRVLA
jgi:hypothetical protein